MAERNLFDAYSADLSLAADAASADVRRLIAQTEGLSDEERYQILRRYYPATARHYGGDASTRAMRYYQAERDAADLDQGYEATSAGAGEASWYVQDVDEAMGRAATGEGHANTDPSDLTAKVAQRVLERADRTIMLNARRDPSHPRWAFVAHAGACGFCVMCSSWGWEYSEKGAKAKRHNGCRCTYAVDFSGDPHLDGYDPDAMRDAYARAEEAVHDDVERQWDAMSSEERAGYKRKGRSAKDVYKTRRVTEEMNRRNRDWLQTGAPRLRSKEPGAKPSKKERDVGTCLLMQGLDVRFIKEVNKTHVKTADAYLNGEVWEFKVPEGWNGEHTIRKQFYRARDKGTDKLLISGTKNGASVQEMEKWVLATFDKGDYQFISEVLLLSPDGERLVRLHR